MFKNDYDDFCTDGFANEEVFEEYIKNLTISLANLEKLGVSLLIIGYAYFFYGAQLDILEVNECNDTGNTPTSAFLFGQQLSLLGYIVLWIVAKKRLDQISLRNKLENEEFPLWPFHILVNSYFLSIIANAIRVQAFAAIDTIEKNINEAEN